MQWRFQLYNFSNLFGILRLPETLIMLDKLNITIFFFMLNQISGSFSCLAECCSSVLLWSPRNVLWTSRLSISTRLSREWIDFHFWPNLSFKYVQLILGPLFNKSSIIATEICSVTTKFLDWECQWKLGRFTGNK